jgi:hypothetical protein
MQIFAYVPGIFAWTHTICLAPLEIFRALVRTIFTATLGNVSARDAVLACVPEILRAHLRRFMRRPWRICLHRDLIFCVFLELCVHM